MDHYSILHHLAFLLITQGVSIPAANLASALGSSRSRHLHQDAIYTQSSTDSSTPIRHTQSYCASLSGNLSSKCSHSSQSTDSSVVADSKAELNYRGRRDSYSLSHGMSFDTIV